MSGSDDGFIFIEHCALYHVDISAPRVNFKVTESTVRCAYCKPGYKPNVEYNGQTTYQNINYYTTSCTLILNCAVSKGTFINACSECRENFAFKMKGSVTKPLDYKNYTGFDYDITACVRQENNKGKEITLTPHCWILSWDQKECVFC